MKKIGLALLLLLFTGCTILKVDERSFDSIINTVLYKDINLINTSYDGYKFYKPRGMTVKEYNSLEIHLIK